jgi:biotin carboxylase
MDRPLLIMVGSSYAANRSYIFEAISSRYRLWLMNPAAPSWEDAYLHSSTVVDCLDADKLTAAAREVVAGHEVAGVFCYDEAFIEPASQASAALGFTTWDPAAVARCRDKSATRAAVRSAGLFQPASRPVATLAEARAFADEVGYPVILKPRNLGASMGVRKVDGPADLAAMYAVTDGIRMSGIREFDEYVIVEEFVEGPEIAIDSVFFEGECQPIVVAHKILGTEPPYEFDEQGHDVRADDPLLTDPELVGALERSHAAVGFRNGVTHTEFKLTPRGLCLVEINARMGGDLIPYLGYLTSGYDESLAAADVAAGRRPAPVVRGGHLAASVRFACPPYDLEVTVACVREDLVRPPIHKAVLAVRPGSVLHLPPKDLARYGYVIAVADTMAQSRDAVADPDSFFEVTGRPLNAEAASTGATA